MTRNVLAGAGATLVVLALAGLAALVLVVRRQAEEQGYADPHRDPLIYTTNRGIEELPGGVRVRTLGALIVPLTARTPEQARATFVASPSIGPELAKAPVIEEAARLGLGASDFNLKVLQQRAQEQLAPVPITTWAQVPTSAKRLLGGS